MTEADIPAGFAPIFRTSPFLDTIGPLYSAGSGASLVIGMRVQEKHTNARGTLHGGVLASIADVALGYGLATSTSPPTSMVTANLSVDFAGGARSATGSRLRSTSRRSARAWRSRTCTSASATSASRAPADVFLVTATSR